MALIPVTFIIGLITLLMIAGWSMLGVPATIVATLLLAGLGIGLIRYARRLGLAGTPDPSRAAR